MKKRLLAAAGLAFLLAAPAAMADDQNGKNKPSDHTGPGAPQDVQGVAPQGNGGAMGGPGGSMSGPDNRANAPNRDNMSIRDNAMRPANAPPKTILRRPARTTIMKYRANVSAPRKFHITAYRQPPGYSARRWTFGQHLPRTYFARDYWITNFWLYGLMQPWDGYEWVRVGDDALLVDVDTGEVIRVEYDVFY